MSIHKLLFVGLFLLAVQAVNASDVHLSRDTLYCNLESTDVGTLKERASQISDLNVIKTMVLAGYIAQSDEDFIHTYTSSHIIRNFSLYLSFHDRVISTTLKAQKPKLPHQLQVAPLKTFDRGVLHLPSPYPVHPIAFLLKKQQFLYKFEYCASYRIFQVLLHMRKQSLLYK